MTQKQPFNFFRSDEILTTKRAILVLCIGIAFVFWLITKLSKSYQTTISCQIVYKTPANKAVAGQPTNTLEIEVQGKGWQLLSLLRQKNQLRLEVPVSESTSAVPLRVLRKSLSEILPSDIQVLRTVPEMLTVQLDNQATKKVPLLLNLQKTDVWEYQFAQPIQLQPDSVAIAGSKVALSKIKAWYTEPISIANLIEKTKGEIGITQSNTIKVSGEKASYNVVLEQVTEREMELPIEIENTKDSIQLIPDRVKVVCTVGLSQYDQLSPADFKATADFAQITTIQPTQVPIFITHKPEKTRIVSITPASVDYIIVKND